jgi:hypothetical protein
MDVGMGVYREVEQVYYKVRCIRYSYLSTVGRRRAGCGAERRTGDGSVDHVDGDVDADVDVDRVRGYRDGKDVRTSAEEEERRWKEVA